MPRTRSINQNIPHRLLPDFRNLGTVLRIVLLANAFALVCAVAQVSTAGELWQRMLLDSALLQPVLLSVLLALYALNEVLPRFAYWRSVIAIVLLAACITLFFSRIGGELFVEANESAAFLDFRRMLLAALLTFVLLTYFRWRAMAMSPALQDARLQALQARIRPHFLFNSLNAILGVMREDPRRAEAALEELAELFRVLMRDNRELVPLSEEIALARKYLDIEKLRLGERLQVSWEMGDCPPETLAPPLLLQPLLENAVYHGIEPSTVPGEIHVRISAIRNGVRIEIDNPRTEVVERRTGNRMALDNLRERLMLFYDLEARLDSGMKDGRYCVCVDLPKRVVA